MSSKELYMIQNDKGEYLGIQAYEYDPSWNLGGGFAFKDMDQALGYAKTNGGHVVPLVEKPEPVVVSEEEAEMLKKASNLRDWRPAAVISKYAYEHERHSCDDEVLLEDRLMRAYVNGWTVEKSKLWNVKVPKKWSGDDKHYWTKEQDGALTWAYLINNDYMIPAQQFTAAEIEHYGLGECERVEVTDDGL